MKPPVNFHNKCVSDIEMEIPSSIEKLVRMILRKKKYIFSRIFLFIDIKPKKEGKKKLHQKELRRNFL